MEVERGRGEAVDAMKLHTKYYLRFLWLCRLTGLADSQLRMFIASIESGEQKRLGDYIFKLLCVKRAGKDILYSIEVYFVVMDNNNHNDGSRKSRPHLVLKSPLLVDAPRRNSKRHIRAAGS